MAKILDSRKILSVGDKPLKEACLNLYFINMNHNILVAGVLTKGWSVFSFRRSMNVEVAGLWENLKSRCEEVDVYGGREGLCGC